MMLAAIEYARQGLSVIPLRGKKYAMGKTQKELEDNSKAPLIEWIPFQQKIAAQDEIESWFKKWPEANVGIVTGATSNLTVVDCDSTQAVELFRSHYQGNTATAKTPRGTHYYFKYADGLRNKAKITDNIDIRSEGGYVVAPPSINYNGLPYIWLRSALEVAPEPLGSILDSFHLLYMHPRDQVPYIPYKEDSYNSLQSLQYLTEGSRDESLFKVAICLIDGGQKIPFVVEVLRMLAENCTPPFPPREVEAKIKSAVDKARRKERNLKQEISQWVSLQPGYFHLTELYNSLQILTKEEKNNVSIIMHRLDKEEHVVEKYGNKRGCYRLVNKEYEVLDILNAPDNPLDFHFPLQMENHCHIYPKNVIVISGVANMGKSSLAFEIARLNRKLFPDKKVLFQTTEAGDTEIRDKLKRYPQDQIPLQWWVDNVVFIPRPDNWADIVDPDCLNVIDYVVDYLDSYKVPFYIQQIHNKMKNGVAVVVIQKDPNKPHGQGGQGTRHAARLAIDIEFGKVTLMKVKSPIKHPPNYKHPDGIFRKFDLEQTWKFQPKGDWKWEEEKDYSELSSPLKGKKQKPGDDEGGYI